MKLVIIDYGAGNTKSIQFAFERLGIEARLSHDRETILSADKLIFPGVGEASSAMSKLKASGLNRIIPDLNQPVLGICLGMQLLCLNTEEGQTEGLGIFQTRVKRFSDKVKVPHMGWNTVNELRSELFDKIDENAYMYLVHSFYAENCAEAIAQTDYELTYASALKHKNFYGVQFHPEKSSTVGEQLLINFLEL